jgi:hypothetical protein
VNVGRVKTLILSVYGGEWPASQQSVYPALPLVPAGQDAGWPQNQSGCSDREERKVHVFLLLL